MNRAVYAAASGSVAALARLDAATQNLANVSTAGYKATRPIFRVAEQDGGPRGAVDPVLGRTAAQVVEVETARDFSQGPIKASGNPLDVAISGDGFFAVATPRGERYTRQGTFSLDNEGFLVTAHGERVQGDNGDVRVGQGNVAIGDDGRVVVDGSEVGRIKLVTFGDNPALQPEGATLFAPVPGATPTPIDPSRVRVEGGAIEGANVDAVAGMIELVDVARGFEQYTAALKQLDEIAKSSINDLGRV
jgi:flagellar basal-body rod protein FlgF